MYSPDHESYSLPGAVGMYALSLGIQNIGQSLPLPVYALLSGLNASIVGIIALAAVHLAEKAIRDKLTRIQVLFGACAGVCYNALWYFPILMLAGGLASVIWDGWMAQQIRRVKPAWQRRHSRPAEPEETTIASDANGETQSVPVELQEVTGNGQSSNAEDSQQTASVRSRKATNATRTPRALAPTSAESAQTGGEVQPSASHSIRIRIGFVMLVLFFGRILSPLSCIVDVCILMNWNSVLYCHPCRPGNSTPATARSRSLRQYVLGWHHHLRRWSRRHPASTLIRRCTGLGLRTRLPYRPRTHPVIPGTQFQFRRLSRCVEPTAFALPDSPRCIPCWVRYFPTRYRHGGRRAELLANFASAEVGY